MNSQRSDVAKINMIEKGKKKIGINEAIKHNKTINNSLSCKYKMKFYCLKCRKDTENTNPKVSGTSNGKIMISKWAICDNKKSRFIKNQEAKGILSSLGLKTPLSEIPILGDTLF